MNTFARRTALLLPLIVGFVSFVPASAHAQGTSGIAGVVRDTSGGVLPGVTVEAASPGLIEKTRAVVTDESGQYKIIDLPGGTYSVTFTLTGFSTIRREGIELTANFTANVPAELKVGGLEETLTVSGQAPVVDVQTTSTQKVVSGEMLFALPMTKEMGGFATVTVGATINPTAQDVGGNIDPMNAYTIIHGGHYADNRALLDGMQFNGEGNGRGFYFNPSAASEVSVQLGGQTAEFENGGVQASLVPKDGGNHFSGLFSGAYTNHNLQTDNLTPELQARGLKYDNKTKVIWDANAAVGGPIKRDKLWFYTSHRTFGFTNYVPGDFFNATQGTPVYTPDLSRPAEQYERNYTDGIRFTWQASQKNKFNISYDIENSKLCQSCTPLFAPEATWVTYYANPDYLMQAKWTNIASKRLLFELADSTLIFRWPNYRRRESLTAVSILEASTGYRYNGPIASSIGGRQASESNQRGNIFYVTGSHAFKVGFTSQEGWHDASWDQYGPQPGQGSGLVAYTFFNGNPLSLTEFAEPITFKERLKLNLGLYAQDQWTIGRLTLNYGIRYDQFHGFVPAQSLNAGPFVPARTYAKVDCVPCWKDINPRVAASYDLFGNGKTALKVNFGRFNQADIYTLQRANNPVLTAVTTTNRTWKDTNGNFAPDCDLTNPNANGECGAIDNVNFGLNNPKATVYASDVINGFNARPANWQTSALIQTELLARVSVTVGYYRTSWANFQTINNTATAASDYNPYCITAPVHSHLPNGGGNQICGLYDIRPALFGASKNVVSLAPSKQGNQSEVYQGVDINLNARFASGFNVGGGVSTGRTATNDCGWVLGNPQYVVYSPTTIGTSAPTAGAFATGGNLPRLNSYCDVTPPWSSLTQVKVNALIPLPYSSQVSATYQSLPGIPIFATYVATNAQIAPSLGRNLAAGAAGTATVELIPPMTQFENRINQFDIRLSKRFILGPHKDIEPEFDIYNVFNASSILSENVSYGPNWLRPTQILAPRLLKFGAKMTF
jgi:hypothetical protein